MPEFLTGTFANGPHVAPAEILARLLVALAFGIVIAAIYEFTRRNQGPSSSFAMTLLMLCVLIAMVTQVIGDNVARAFSLVGALSIVRFRTVVRDTQDTAYVILAVTVGMAVGAHSLWVASIGIAVTALAELLAAFRQKFRGGASSPDELAFLLTIRAAAEQDPDALVAAALGGHASSPELMSMNTIKQGGGLDATYRVALAKGHSAQDLIRALANQAGVQSVQLVRAGFGDD